MLYSSQSITQDMSRYDVRVWSDRRACSVALLWSEQNVEQIAAVQPPLVRSLDLDLLLAVL